MRDSGSKKQKSSFSTYLSKHIWRSVQNKRKIQKFAEMNVKEEGDTAWLTCQWRAHTRTCAPWSCWRRTDGAGQSGSGTPDACSPGCPCVEDVNYKLVREKARMPGNECPLTWNSALDQILENTPAPMSKTMSLTLAHVLGAPCIWNC